MIKILHISDFHFCQRFKADFKMRAEQLCSEIKKHHIDIIVFSGDLVYNGGCVDDFFSAKEVLVDNLEAATGLRRENIVLALGNHDVDRESVPDMLRRDYKDIKTPGDLDKWLKDKNNEPLSLESSKNYLDFIKDFYKGCEVSCSNYYNTRILDVNGISIGIAALNSAWASYDSKTDRGQLMLPSHEVSNALDAVRNSNVVLITMHHRLDDFKEPFMWSMCDSLYPYTHLLCTGHHHLTLDSDYRFGGNCVAHSEGCAIYNKFDASSQYGFKIISIETGVDKKPVNVKVDEFYYINGGFVLREGVELSMVSTVERQREIEFQKNLLRLRQAAESKADDLFVSDKINDSDGVTFKKIFSTPVIKDISPIEEADDKKTGKTYSVEDILKEDLNFLIHGFQGKCGKTSLLWKLYLDSISQFYTLGYIPLYFNCNFFKNDEQYRLNIIKRIRTDFSINTQDAKDLFKTKTLLLLLDDVDLSKSESLNSIGEELKEIAHYKIVACLGDSLSAKVVSSPIDGIAFKKLYFHAIGQKEIHQLTKKWPNIASKKAEIEQKILSVFKQMHIPFNYWTTSLFLWIFDKTDGDKIRNNFELVNLYVEKLLNKSSIVQDKSLHIEYRDLCVYLACLAHEMLSYENEDYTIPYPDFIKFTEEFRDKNKRFPRNYNDVINTLLSSRVLIRDHDERVSIRLKGVFEFFLAYYMTSHNEWRDEIIDDDTKYLAFANELELYAGFNADDSEYVQKIYAKTVSILKPLIDNPEYSNIDIAFQEKVKQLSYDVEKIREAAGELITKSLNLSDLEKEEMLPAAIAQNVPIDSSEVRKKVYANCYDSTVANFEKSLFLLCRVYRNSNICNGAVGDEIFNYILDACCKFSFAIVNTPYDKEDADEEIRKLVLILYRFIPIVIQAFFFDAISQFNLDRVFDEKLTELKEGEVNGKYFKIFLLLFTLLDLDIKSYIKLVDDVQKYTPKGAFSYAAFAKICLLVLKNSDGGQDVLDKLLDVADRLNTDMLPNNKTKVNNNSFRNQLAVKINNKKLMDAEQKRMIEADFGKED